MARSAAAVQADLDLFYALRTKAATDGIAEYAFDSGQGRQSVKRYTLAEIRQTIRDLEAELIEASGDSGPTFITFDRGRG
jgi:hypothetical protein